MVEIDTGRFQAERCVPMLQIKMKVQENISLPDKRFTVEEKVRENFSVPERRMFSAVRGGPAIHENLFILIEISESEFWSSINRKVESFNGWVKETDLIERHGRDVSVTIEAGDPEMIIREAEEGFSR